MNIGFVYLRGNYSEEALRELQEGEEVDGILYCEASAQLPRTLRIVCNLIGSNYIVHYKYSGVSPSST